MPLVPLTVRTAGPPPAGPATPVVRHDVTATFSGSRWMLHFAAGDGGGAAAVAAVARLTGADVVARRLVAGRLGCPPESVRVRIVPDAEQLRVLRRTRGV